MTKTKTADSEPDANEAEQQPDDTEEEEWGDAFDNPDVDQLAPTDPTDRRERTTRAAAAIIGALAVGLFAAKMFGWGPFNNGSSNSESGAGTTVNVVLPESVVAAIEAAHTPGKLTEFGNRPSAQDPNACATLPSFTNEALYGLAAGDANALCERVLENGANPCNLWIGVALTDKGAVFYLSSTGAPLPGQQSSPARVAWCPPTTTTTTTTAVTAPAQQPGA